MITRSPSSKASPAAHQGSDREGLSPYARSASDEERIARSTAWYEGDLQDSVDEAIQTPGKLLLP
jgi:hypothetical protein